MNGFCQYIASVALAAGLFVGYLDHRARKDSPSAARPEVEKLAPPAPPPEEPRATAPLKKESPPAPKLPPPPTEDELAKAIRQLEDLILEEDFKAAPEVAVKLVERHGKNPEAVRLLDRVRRAERKAVAYAALIASLETRSLPEGLHTVTFQNGNSLVAKSVRETGQRLEIEYVLGGKGTMDRDRVASVKPLPLKAYLAQRWKELKGEVADRKDPFDIFFLGVRKCFRDGLRREGIGLLDRLLSMPDSKQLVAMYAVDTDRNAVRAWEQAAGRTALDPLPVEVSAAQDLAGAVTYEDPDEGGLDGAALDRAREMIERAEATYQAAGADQTKVFDARVQIMAAAKVLYALPAQDRRVNELNRRAGDLLNLVMKER